MSVRIVAWHAWRSMRQSIAVAYAFAICAARRAGAPTSRSSKSARSAAGLYLVRYKPNASGRKNSVVC